jgi:hypothetical protein
MTTTINASTSAGLVQTADTSGSLALQTAGTTAVTINTSQQVGIGTTSPASPLQVNTAGVNTTVQINSTDANGGYGANLSLNNTGTGGRQYVIYSTSNGDGDVGGGKLKFTDATASATRMVITSAGEVCVNGFASPVNGLKMAITNGSVKWSFGPDGSGNYCVFNASGAGVYVTNGGTSWTGTSDERLKTDLIPITNGLQKVNSLRSVTGRFKTDEEGISRSFLIAQDVQAVLPEAVNTLNDELGTLGLAYTDVIPLLVASIKELKAINDTQAETLSQQATLINALTARVETLEAK